MLLCICYCLTVVYSFQTRQNLRKFSKAGRVEVVQLSTFTTYSDCGPSLCWPIWSRASQLLQSRTKRVLAKAWAQELVGSCKFVEGGTVLASAGPTCSFKISSLTELILAKLLESCSDPAADTESSPSSPRSLWLLILYDSVDICRSCRKKFQSFKFLWGSRGWNRAFGMKVNYYARDFVCSRYTVFLFSQEMKMIDSTP